MSGTKINDLVANSGQKSNEDSMVDSIINELNNDGNGNKKLRTRDDCQIL